MPPRRERPAGGLLALGAALLLVCVACQTTASVVPNRPSLGRSFASGACHRFSPSHGRQQKTVFIDPGHGSPDPGTSGRTQQGSMIEEKTATLAVALDLAKLLRDQGYTVVLARTADSSVIRLGPGDLDRGAYSANGDHRDLLARIDCANAAKADLLLSIHFNGFSDPAVGGAETFYDGARPFAADNRRFATLIQQKVLAALANAGWQIPDRGIALDASDNAPTLTAQAAAYPYLLELGPAQSTWLDDPSRMPGALSESLFLSDPIEATIAASMAGQQAIARGFAEAIDAYFAAPSSAAGGTPDPPPRR